MSDYLIISTSLNPESKSYSLAHTAHEALKSQRKQVELVDLRNMPLPFCDGRAAYADSHVQALTAKVKEAKGILIAVPVYNYSSSSSAKNLIELVGKAFTRKTVGFMCAAGGNFSYMSILPLANSLTLDFRSVIVPRYVYASSSDFEDNKLNNDPIKTRITLLAKELTLYAEVHTGLVFED